jgi:hypothetical protein
MGQKQVFQTALTEVRFNPVGAYPEQLGTIRMENNAVYKFVAFTGTTVIAAGDALCYVVFGTDPNLVVTDAANSIYGAGIAMAAVATGTIAAGALCYACGWIQIKGIAVCSTAFGGPPVAGNSLTNIGAANKVLQVMAAFTSPQVGICYNVAGRVAILDYPF